MNSSSLSQTLDNTHRHPLDGRGLLRGQLWRATRRTPPVLLGKLEAFCSVGFYWVFTRPRPFDKTMRLTDLCALFDFHRLALTHYQFFRMI